MSRKIDYSLIAKSQLIRKNLNKQNAIINAISKGEINKAELLSDTILVPRNPIYQSLITQQKITDNLKEKKTNKVRDNANTEILTQLRAIADKPDRNNNLELLEDIRDLLKPRAEGSIPLPALEDKGAAAMPIVDLDKGLNEDLFKDYPKPSDLFIEGDMNRLKELNTNLKDYIKYLNGESLHDTDKAILRNEVVKYRKRLLQVIEAVNLKIKTGSGIFTTINDLKERLQILVGSIDSGNSNKELKNELADILHYLYKNEKLTKSMYKRLMNLTK